MNFSDRTAANCLMLKTTKPATACMTGELSKPALLALVSCHT
jgi:hypothetical protein